MQLNDLIKVGKIVGTHGYKGTVKVMPLTDFPERFQPEQRFIVNQGANLAEFTLETSSPHRGQLLIKFKELTSLEEAERYRNAYIHVEPKDLHTLPEGYYYQFQLVGMEVYDDEKGYLGRLAEILETGANDVYVIRSDQYGEVLIPAIAQVIAEVDVKRNRMQVRLLPGLVGEDL